MRSTLEDLKTRRAVRSYNDQPVTREEQTSLWERLTEAFGRGERKIYSLT